MNDADSLIEVSCWAYGIKAHVATITKGKTIPHLYPHHHQLSKKCMMHLSHNLQYWVLQLWLEDLIIMILKANFLNGSNLKSLEELTGTHSRNWTWSSLLYKEMMSDVLRLENLDFFPLKAPSLDYTNQQYISLHQVDLAMEGLIHNGMHPGMLLRYPKSKYTGESRNVNAILQKVSPYIDL